MAPPTLTPQVISLAGTVLSFQAAAGTGDTVACSNTLFIIVRNGGGGSITATVNRPPASTYEPNVAITPVAVTVPAGGERWIGPVDRSFIDINLGDFGGFVLRATRGTLGSISYSGVTSVTIAACRFREPGDA
jgi:hypothetical protein